MVHFFGKFCLESKNGRLDEETIHSKKIIKLLAFLLLNNNRMINAEELGELVWGNQDGVNVTENRSTRTGYYMRKRLRMDVN